MQQMVVVFLSPLSQSATIKRLVFVYLLQSVTKLSSLSYHLAYQPATAIIDLHLTSIETTPSSQKL